MAEPGLQGWNPMMGLLWLQVRCQLFAAALLLIQGEFS
jgi:hypothetical protein